MTSQRSLGFAAVLQLLERIRPDRLKQSPTAARHRGIRRDKRFSDEICNALNDGRFMTDIARDRRSRLQSKPRRKDRQMAEQALLRGCEKVVAPVECGPERLVAGKRRPASGRQQTETIVQMRSDLGDAE